MAKKDRPHGKCSICGTECRLTFEHVPPEAAFNDARVREADPRKILGAGSLEAIMTPQGLVKQRGAGRFTLCASCNSLTGAWYGTDYVHWAVQGMRHLLAAPHDIQLNRPFTIFPSRVFKQILAMFASACGPKMFAARPDLPRLVLNRDMKGCPEGLRMYVYYVEPKSTFVRQSGVSARLSLDHPTSTYSEIAFPPFGYLLAFASPPPDGRLVDITFFSQSSYDDARELSLSFPVLSVCSPFPGDFRSREELNDAFEASMRGEGN